MSKLKDKNEQILERGRRERALRTPDPGSLPARWYNAYVKENPQARNTPENFCHYYRIVLFWFPLSVVLDKIFFTVTGRVLALAVYASLAAWLLTGGGTDDTTPVVIGAVMIGLPYLVIGACANIDHYDKLNPKYDDEYMFSDEKRKLVRVLAFPITLVSMVIYKFSNDKNKDASLKAIKVLGYAALAVAVAAILWLLGLIIFEVFQEYSWWTIVKNTLIFIGAVILGGGAFIAFLVGMGYLKERVEDKLEDARNNRPMIEVEEDGVIYERRAPSKLKQFFTNAGDLGLVIINVIRTRKWKICPIMDVQEAPDVRTKR